MHILRRHPLAEQVGRAIHGFGGGGSSGSSHGAVESPDNLQSIAFARVLDLWGEGEIAGFVHPSNVLQDVALNGTPVANADGSLNFQNVKFDSRAGTQSQSFMSGFPDVENETSVNVELKSSANWTQTLTDLTLTAVRVRLSMPAISQQDTTTGDIKGYTVQYAIDIATDGGSYQQCISSAFTGKSTSKYERAERVELPTATTGWTVRVRRLTANANSATIADTVMIESYTEITDGKFRYPNSAYGGLIIDASQFSAIPTRAYYMKGRIVSVPSNYDPDARTYTGTWDGTFKPAWTNNPAWIFYDLVTNSRFGLGDYVTAAMVNKWNLYTIAQYCDELVPDGFGGQEPRMTCNVFLQTQADAYKVLQDLASVFRGITYWAGGAIQAVADMPGDPVYPYTAANVIDGKFTYQGSSRKTRYTVALVSWNDQTDFGRAKVEYVSDDEGIARYGVQSTSVTAFGCSSRGQAHRVGLWTLYTSRLETGTVTFKVGLDGTIAAPGQIIRVQDPARAGKRQAGRISAATATDVTVDSAPTVAVGDSLTCTLPTGVTETHTVTAVAGNVISVAAPGFSTVPGVESVWVVESSSLVAETYRVVSVVEDNSGGQGSSANDGGGGTPLSFTITAVQHNASKFNAIEFGDALMVPTVTAIPPTTQPGPASVTLTSSETAGSVLAGILLTIAWPSTTNAVKYQVEWRKDNGEWQPLGGPVTGLSADLHNAKPGIYVARVRAINANGIGSVPKQSNALTVADQVKQPTTMVDVTNTANIAAANTPTVQNPWFKNGANGWTLGSGWTVDNWPRAVHTGTGTAVTSAITNAELNPVKAGQLVTVSAVLTASGADGSCAVACYWYDANGNYLSSTSSVSPSTVSGTALNTYCRIVAQAPTNAAYAVAAAVVTNHSAGTYTANFFMLTVPLASQDELPDGGTYGRTLNSYLNGNRAVMDWGDTFHRNKTMDYVGDGSVYRRLEVLSGTTQTIAIPNCDFSLPLNAQGAIPGVTYNGMVVALQVGSSPGPSGANNYMLVGPGSASGGNMFGLERVPCSPGDYLSGDVWMWPNTSTSQSAGYDFFNTAGSYVGGATATSSPGSGWIKYSFGGKAPAGTAYAIRVYSVNGANTTAGFSTMRASLNDVRVAGSGAMLGDQYNAPGSLTRGYGAVRSATALTAFSSGAVNVNAHTVTYGTRVTSYNAKTNAVTGLAVGGTYTIYTRDGGAGGSPTFVATTSQSAANSFDDAYIAGNVTIPSSGSSGGGGAGGGTGSGCVGVNMFLRRGLRAKDLRWWHRVDCARGEKLFRRFQSWFPCIRFQPCVRIVAEGGAELECSISTPFDLRDGSMLFARDMYGHEVLTDHGWRKVVDVIGIGIQPVRRIHVWGNHFAAGTDPGNRIYSHNPVK